MVRRAKSFCRQHWFASCLTLATVLGTITTVAVNVMTLKRMTFGDTPPAHLMGWAGEAEAAKARSELKGRFKQFKISGQPQASSAGKVVKLWDAAKLVNGGEHLPTLRQEIGDCVAFGYTAALQYLQCVAIANGAADEYHPIFPPYHYACGRVIIGRGQIRGPDGSVGSWQADAVQEYGCIPATAGGLPEYSGQVARQWATRKPADEYMKIGREHLVKSAAPINSYAEARDALANGYPVPVCSNRGFEMRARASGGKHWGTPSGQWAHCMCFIAVDDTVDCPSFAGGGKGALYLLNSWGPDAHGAPADDAPPGGFWVSAKVADQMLKQDDSFALSNFTGFPAQDLQWVIPIGRRRAANRAAAIGLAL